eukprot:TRINITY_DN28434_c0_g1_i1.p1 TRINITY_DN28434_c0_g1~~TRINITY_DN28434_c0_g1_i1.p1  ORF type:complete len:886 (-),score=135.75 TRINITY_DN28434_c0_g1_i1:225-2882(-)
MVDDCCGRRNLSHFRLLATAIAPTLPPASDDLPSPSVIGRTPPISSQSLKTPTASAVASTSSKTTSSTQSLLTSPFETQAASISSPAPAQSLLASPLKSPRALGSTPSPRMQQGPLTPRLTLKDLTAHSEQLQGEARAVWTQQIETLQAISSRQSEQAASLIARQQDQEAALVELRCIAARQEVHSASLMEMRAAMQALEVSTKTSKDQADAVGGEEGRRLQLEISTLADAMERQQKRMDSVLADLIAKEDAKATEIIATTHEEHGEVASKGTSKEIDSSDRAVGLYFATKYHELRLAAQGKRFQSTWALRQAEVLSERDFKLIEFLKSFMYEVLPVAISVVLVAWIDGLGAARARGFWPYFFAGMVFDIMIIGMCWVTLCLTFYWTYVGVLDGVNVFDSVSIILFAIVRAATVAVKYATYGEGERSNAGVEGRGIGGDVYVKTNRLFNRTMGGAIMNFAGMQHTLLLENVYASSLAWDCDLSCATIRMTPAAASKTWKEVRKHLAVVAANSEKMRVKMGAEASGVAPEDVRLEHIVSFSAYSAIHGKDSRASSEGVGEPSLVVDLFDMDEASIEELVSKGELPAAAYALLCAYSCHSVKPNKGRFAFASMMMFSAMLAWMPALLNWLVFDRPPLGSTWQSTVVLSLQPLCFTTTFLLTLYYVWAPCYFYFCQVKVDAFLNKSVAGCSVSTGPNPYIDLSIPQNVIAWGAVWRMMHGPSFHPTFQLRSNMYLVISFGAIVLDAAIQATAFQADPDLPLASKVQSFCRLLAMSLAVSGEILLAHFCNMFTPKHISFLAKRRLQFQSLIACCSKEHAAEYEQSVALLASLEAEISAADTERPTTVGFLRGDIARLSTVGILLMALMYADVQMLQAKLGIDTSGLPFR